MRKKLRKNKLVVENSVEAYNSCTCFCGCHCTACHCVHLTTAALLRNDRSNSTNNSAFTQARAAIR